MATVDEASSRLDEAASALDDLALRLWELAELSMLKADHLHMVVSFAGNVEKAADILLDRLPAPPLRTVVQLSAKPKGKRRRQAQPDASANGDGKRKAKA